MYPVEPWIFARSQGSQSQHTWENRVDTAMKWEIWNRSLRWSHRGLGCTFSVKQKNYSTALKKQIEWPRGLSTQHWHHLCDWESWNKEDTVTACVKWPKINGNKGVSTEARMAWWQRFTQHISLLNAWTSQSLSAFFQIPLSSHKHSLGWGGDGY